jgi:hypothetical protein
MRGTLGKKNYGKKTQSRRKIWEKRRGKHASKINE